MARLTDLLREQEQPSERSGPERQAPAGAAPLQADEGAEGSNTSAPDQTDWYHLAREELGRIAEAAQQGSLRTLGDLPSIAVGMVDTLSRNDHILMEVLGGPAGPQVITNPINVAILAVKVGMGLAYERLDLERLALAALLHDAGMFTVPEFILMRSGPLSTGERAVIEKHPEVGAGLLNGLESGYGWLAQVAMQEHERWLGQGYPQGLKGPQIHPYAQVIGIADTFDALISPRPYRRRFVPHEAVRELLLTEKSSFSRDVIKTLVERLSLYPLGTYVRLNTGEVGVVKELKSRFPLRPVIQINPGAEPGFGEPKTLDLSTTTLLHIVEVIREVEAT